MFEFEPVDGPRLTLHLSVADDVYQVRITAVPAGVTLVEGASGAHRLVGLDDVLSLAAQPVFHEQVGQMLFGALFPHTLVEVYHSARRLAAEIGQRLTLELHFARNAVVLTRYPWELLHDGAGFLLMSGAVTIVRSLPFPAALTPADDPGPLDVLLVEAQPADRPPIPAVYEGLLTTFDASMRADQLDLAYLMPPTWDSLMDWLLAGAPQVLHVAGHSDPAGSGWLILTNEQNASDRVAALAVGQALYSTRLKLVILTAAAQTGDAVWGTVAPCFVLGGVPAAIALQADVPPAVTQRFVEGIYRALLAGHDLETALVAGRQQLGHTAYWHCPVLYRRAEPSITRQPAALNSRVDVIAPSVATAHVPLRVGVWLRPASSSAPSSTVVQRLIGYPLAEPALEEETVTRNGVLQPGAIQVRITVMGGDVHGPAAKIVPVGIGFVVPPVWFPITPYADMQVTVEVLQNARVLAVNTRHIPITDQPVDYTESILETAHFVAFSSSQRASGEFSAVPTTPDGGDSAPTNGEPRSQTGSLTSETAEADAHPPVREPDHHSRTGRREPVQDRQPESNAELAWARVDAEMDGEALDGVLDWFQTGEQPPQEEEDPLVSGEFVPHVRDATDDSPVIEHVLDQARGAVPLDPPRSSLDTLPTLVDALPDEPTIVLDHLLPTPDDVPLDDQVADLPDTGVSFDIPPLDEILRAGQDALDGDDPAD